MFFSELYHAKKSHCLNVVKPRTIMIMPHLVTPKKLLVSLEALFRTQSR